MYRVPVIFGGFNLYFVINASLGRATSFDFLTFSLWWDYFGKSDPSGAFVHACVKSTDTKCLR